MVGLWYWSQPSRSSPGAQQLQLASQQDWHPFDEIFKKTEKRERRRRGWRRVIEAVLDVLEALPF